MAPLQAGRVGFRQMFTALEHADFRRMWLANGSAQAAAWALIVARSWLVFEETGSGFWVGAVTFAAMGPMVIVPPIAGVLADRFDRRTILAWTYAVNLAHNLVLALLAILGILDAWMVLALSLVNGVARATQMPTSQALAASLVPREKLLNALALNAAAQNGSRLVGWGLVTPILALTGAAGAFVLCTAFYIVGWFLILRIESRSGNRTRAGESYWGSFVNGLNYAFGHPIIRLVVVLSLLHCGMTMGYESLLPGFSHHELHVSAGGFGTLLIGIGVGSFAGSILIAGMATPKSRGWLMLFAGIASGAGQVMLSFTSDLSVAFGAAVVMGAASTAFMTSGQAVTQAIAVDEFRGRIASINTMGLGGVMSIMNLVNGALSGADNAHVLLYAEGMIFVFVMLASLIATTSRHIYVKGIQIDTAPAPA